MNAETLPPDPAQESAVESGAAPVGRRPWKRRAVKRVLGVGVAVLAAALVTLFTVDLGRLWPGLVPLAERAGSRYLERPLHIGRISASLTPGLFALDNVVIEGKNPGDRPFMSIARVDLEVPWWTLFRRELHVRLTLDDWQMVVESWPNGVHNIPRLTPRGSGGGRAPFTTTVEAHARGGSFTYEDHATPWKVVAPNLNFSLVRVRALGQYRGLAGFSGGQVQIQSYPSMATSMTTRFILDGSKVRLEHIDLVTDGSRSHINGDIDFRRWPNQVYYVNSEVDFARMKEIFFSREPWIVDGEGTFTGTFSMFPGGRDLSGAFTSETASVNGLEFPNLHGSLTWTPTLFAVTHAETDFLGGHARFNYSLAPLGSPGGSIATFTTDYSDIDVFELDRIMNLRGLKVAGLASGDLSLQWPNGKFGAGRTGHGRTFVRAPDGVLLASAELPIVPVAPTVEPTPFDAGRRTATLLVGANTGYTIDPTGITFEPSTAATSHSFVSFSGRLARDGSSRFPFHVTSHDWQESDRLLASIMTAVSGPTNAVEVAGRGTFDGEMTGSFSAPRITGRFAGESMKVWDVVWGRATGDLVIEGGYVDITNSRVGEPGAARSIVPNGRFALGFRRDDRDEITAKVTVSQWPLVDLRHAFELDSWPMDGTIALADLNLTGKYKAMFGSGVLRIVDGRAWEEPFEEATGDLILEGTGMQISRVEMTKGPGAIRGAARIGWDGTYAFNAAGENVAVETLDNFKVPAAPMSGRLRFNVSGAGEFEQPTYQFEGSIQDLFVGDEGIGAVNGSFSVAGTTMTVDRLVVASSRLQVLGSGTIAFDDVYTSDLRLRFSETALDPYLKFVMTDDISPYTRVVVGGSLAVRGPLSLPKDLLVDSTIDTATLTLFEHSLRNDGPFRLRMEGGQFAVTALKLAGEGTNLALAGGANLERRTLSLSAQGSSSLAILGLFPQFSGITASGSAALDASLTGGFDTPRLAGSAVLTEGRLRPLDSPHSLEAVNGRIEFGVNPVGANTVSMRGVTGRVADGEVVFGGDIEFDGYALARYNLTASGTSMRLRYPAGFRSTVDMNLRMVGPVDAPRLEGDVDVLHVALVSSGNTGLLGLAGAGSGTLSVPTSTGAAPVTPIDEGTPLALAIKVTAPPLNFIDIEDARVEGRADLDVRGTFDVPVLSGRIDIQGGELHAFANRFVVREGSVEFREGQAEPVVDLAAETRTRVEGTTYTINLAIRGPFSDLRVEWSSDPSLPATDIANIVAGGAPSVLTAEQRSLGASEEAQQQMLAAVAAAVLTTALTSRVSDVVENALAVDTVQLTPVLSNTLNFQQQNPSARITLGKRISQRLYLTYSRTVGNIDEEIILLEYDQNDRLSWVLSKNEDRTVALDFRLRFVF